MDDPLPSASAISEPPSDVPPPETPVRPARLNRRTLRLVAALAIIGVFGKWHLDLRERQIRSETQLASARAQLAGAEAQVREAEHVRLPLSAVVAQPRRIEDERQLPDWTPALRALALAFVPGVELGRIQAHGETANPGCSAMRLEGVASNRENAERFRRTLEAQLQKNFTGRAVTTRFDRLDDAKTARGTAPGARQAIFAITATVSAQSERLAEFAPPGR